MNQAAKTFLDKTLTGLNDDGLKRELRELCGTQGREVVIEGRKVLNFCSNNYLGLAGDDRLGLAATECIKEEGFGAGASRLVCGNMSAHQKLEEGIAKFKGAQKCLVFSTGYMANVGIISSVFGRDDIIFSDRLNHASIVDGIRLSQARCRRYGHRDMDALEEMLKSSGPFRKRGIITDSVFSMDGDIAPLDQIVALAGKYDCLVMIDEAHALGVMGEMGKGLPSISGLNQRLIFRWARFQRPPGHSARIAAVRMSLFLF
jgi:7-keto-8-aminopelargonate synthetase-like enzyme